LPFSVFQKVTCEGVSPSKFCMHLQFVPELDSVFNAAVTLCNGQSLLWRIYSFC